MDQGCVLLNANYMPIALISLKKAIRLIVKEKVEVIKSHSTNMLHNAENTFKIFYPLVLRLVKFVRKIYGVKVSFSKRNVLIRDNFTCMYCGADIKRYSTLDHVIPKSKGGKSIFENVVACCITCNNKKDNKLPSQAKMYLTRQPYSPTINEFILLQIKRTGMFKYLKELGII